MLCRTAHCRQFKRERVESVHLYCAYVKLHYVSDTYSQSCLYESQYTSPTMVPLYCYSDIAPPPPSVTCSGPTDCVSVTTADTDTGADDWDGISGDATDTDTDTAAKLSPTAHTGVGAWQMWRVRRSGGMRWTEMEGKGVSGRQEDFVWHRGKLQAVDAMQKSSSIWHSTQLLIMCQRLQILRYKGRSQ